MYGPTTALIVVDVQNDFADPGGSLHVPGAEDAVPFINQEIESARGAGSLVVYTQDWHPPSTPHFQKDGGVWPVHCVRWTWGAAFHRELLTGDGPVTRKGIQGEDGYSAFTVADPTTGQTSGTGLESLLRDQGIAGVVIVGLATDYCVKSTALDAASLGMATIVLADGVRAVDLQPGDGARAIEEMRAAGVSVV